MTQEQSVPSLEVTVERRVPWMVVRPSGELSFGTRELLETPLLALADDEDQPRICVDLSSVTFCDSSGIACLLRGSKAARARGGTLVLWRPRVAVTRLVVLLDLTSLLPVVDDAQL
jgi:anti-sigma B factor antagonist